VKPLPVSTPKQLHNAETFNMDKLDNDNQLCIIFPLLFLHGTRMTSSEQAYDGCDIT
jgi:hypothetical protein